MSYCNLIEFNGNEQTAHEFRNAWGGHARVWTAVFDKYVKNSDPFDCWAQRPDDLWEVAHREDVPRYIRNVMAATFDFAVVMRENFGQFAAELRAFVSEFPVPPDYADHLMGWAELVDASSADMIGFYGTSCGENCWRVNVYNDDGDVEDSRPFDFLLDEGAFNVYGYLKGGTIETEVSTKPLDPA